MKPTFRTRTHKRNLLLAFIILITTISIFGFKKMHYTADTDLSLVKHYTDRGACPGIGIANAKLKTKFVDNKLLYILNLTVAKGKKQDLPHSFTVKLIDKDGFDVQYFTVNSSFFVEEVDAAENSVGYSYQSIQIMDADKYQSVAGWNLIWAFD